MASTNKTTNLGLNSWLDTDKPRRADFVEDNQIIDEKLGEHLADTEAHLSVQDREKFNQRVYTMYYVGTGEDSQTFTLPFEPVFVMVFKRDDAYSRYDADTGYTKLNATVFPFQNSNEETGVLKGNSLTVYQTTTPFKGVCFNLNELYGQYGIIAMR